MSFQAWAYAKDLVVGRDENQESPSQSPTEDGNFYIREKHEKHEKHEKRRFKKSVPTFKLLQEERGSASVEMVIFALPLFIPLIILASHVAEVSASKIEVSHLARTSLRAFVTAPSTPVGHARIQQVLSLAASDAGRDPEPDLGSLHRGTERFAYVIECRLIPCIQPFNRIRITLEDRIVGTQVAAVLNTDQWIEGESGYVASQSKRLFGFQDVLDVEERLSPVLEGKDALEVGREILE